MDESTRRIRMGNIYEAIQNAFAVGREVEYEKTINYFSFNFASSRRVTIEYLKAALSNIPHEIVKDKGISWIIPLEEEKSFVREA